MFSFYFACYQQMFRLKYPWILCDVRILVSVNMYGTTVQVAATLFFVVCLVLSNHSLPGIAVALLLLRKRTEFFRQSLVKTYLS